MPRLGKLGALPCVETGSGSVIASERCPIADLGAW
jgi:hypothetical protein